MFSVRQKRMIADAVQDILRATNHPELPQGEISFHLHVDGAEPWSWADIRNNGAIIKPSINPHNKEYPEYAVPVLGELSTDDMRLKHYQGQALQALEADIEADRDALTDVELIEKCQRLATSYPLIMELSRRLERYTGLIRDTIRENQND